MSVAATTRCRSCGAEVWMLEHVRTHKRNPIVNLEAGTYCAAVERVGELHVSHFAFCPAAASWRRKETAGT